MNIKKTSQRHISFAPRKRRARWISFTSPSKGKMLMREYMVRLKLVCQVRLDFWCAPPIYIFLFGFQSRFLPWRQDYMCCAAQMMCGETIHAYLMRRICATLWPVEARSLSRVPHFVYSYQHSHMFTCGIYHSAYVVL